MTAMVGREQSESQAPTSGGPGASERINFRATGLRERIARAIAAKGFGVTEGAYVRQAVINQLERDGY